MSDIFSRVGCEELANRLYYNRIFDFLVLLILMGLTCIEFFTSLTGIGGVSSDYESTESIYTDFCPVIFIDTKARLDFFLSELMNFVVILDETTLACFS